MDAERLAATFVELADTLVDDFDLIEFLYRLVERCTELLAVSAVGLMLADASGRLQVMASSSEETQLLELFQLQNDEGPGLECYRDGQAVDDPDLSTAAQRWPQFAPAAISAGFASVHALPMRLRAETIGSLNFFHAQRGGLRATDIRIGQAMVDVATIGLIQVEAGHRREILIGQLQTALTARIVIEQAKGVLAERHDITPAAAFALLTPGPPASASTPWPPLSSKATPPPRRCSTTRSDPAHPGSGGQQYRGLNGPLPNNSAPVIGPSRPTARHAESHPSPSHPGCANDRNFAVPRW